MPLVNYLAIYVVFLFSDFLTLFENFLFLGNLETLPGQRTPNALKSIILGFKYLEFPEFPLISKYFFVRIGLLFIFLKIKTLQNINLLLLILLRTFQLINNLNKCLLSCLIYFIIKMPILYNANPILEEVLFPFFRRTFILLLLIYFP